ncbi:MAG: bifunctional hydroxymethylpyrimidine kinase/phosphomethylpyrimidine kinase, partial [Anaerolineaceae bacterium]|nr:bifunctional hydroxymethylpyrimidine kinase/phosphomethylpyrimidine kinase [Anaerolineaceae bacterium]
VNESELAALSGMATDSESSVREAAEVLLKRGPKAVVVTLGRNGTFFTQGARRGMVPAFKVEAVDAVGAGDAFVGAFTVAITEGMDIAEAARFGNAAGAVAVTRQGAQASQPTRKEVEALLSNA